MWIDTTNGINGGGKRKRNEIMVSRKKEVISKETKKKERNPKRTRTSSSKCRNRTSLNPSRQAFISSGEYEEGVDL
jgi:hypothetical protein